MSTDQKTDRAGHDGGEEKGKERGQHVGARAAVGQRGVEQRGSQKKCADGGKSGREGHGVKDSENFLEVAHLSAVTGKINTLAEPPASGTEFTPRIPLARTGSS